MSENASEDQSAAPSPAVQARALVRACDTATLATGLGPERWPYASLVLVAVDHDATPLLLISRLAEHTRNAMADGRVSLLFDGTVGLESRLTGPRVTLLGDARQTDDPRHRARFLARHPDAEFYAGFADFSVWRVVPARAHIVAGFGRIHWIEAADYLGPAPAALVEAEEGIVSHMNEDHADALDLYAQVFAGRAGEGWRMTGCDAEGCDLRRGGDVARIPFARAVEDAAGARAELVRLVREARQRLGIS
jgi:putative heme iron utilization protein